MRLLSCALIAVTLAAVAGCVRVNLTPQGQAVRVTSNADAVKGCKYVRQIQTGDHWNGGLASGVAEENANKQMRNDAAAAGANIVLLTSSSTGYTGSTQRGEAYACPVEK